MTMRSAALLLLLATLWDTASCVNLRKVEFDILKSSRPSLFLFTANGCKECDRVQEVLDEVSASLSTTPIATVNCRDDPDACDESQIFTVPTLKFTTGDGDLVSYREVMDAPSITRYLERQSGSPVTKLTSENYLDFTASSRVAVVAFLQPSASEADRQTFESVAERWRPSYSFGSVEGVESANNTKASIAVYSQDNDDVVYYQGKFNVNEIEAFLQDATTPLIYEFDPLMHEKLTKDGKPLAQAFHKKSSDRAELAKSLFPMAKKFKDQMSFMTVLADDYHQQRDHMHIDKDVERGFAIEDARGRAYPMNATEVNADGISKHIQAYLSGTLVPTIKSEPVPEPSEDLPFLTTLVGSNFDDLTLDETRDVLVHFTVPWCEYCDRLLEVMNQLGAKYSEEQLSGKVAVATINVEANDVPIQIDSYPSLRLYRAGTNEIVPFTGAFHQMLTVEQLDSFISSNGKHGVSVVSESKAERHEEL